MTSTAATCHSESYRYEPGEHGNKVVKGLRQLWQEALMSYSACSGGTNVRCAPGLPGRLQSVFPRHVHKRFPGKISEAG